MGLRIWDLGFGIADDETEIMKIKEIKRRMVCYRQAIRFFLWLISAPLPFRRETFAAV